MKIKFHDLSTNVIYDFKNFTYKLIDQDELSYHVKELLVNKIGQDLTINVPTIDDLVLANYPFINNLQPDVVNKIIRRNNRINQLVDHAIKTKKAEKLVFEPLEEKDKFVIELAKQYLYDLNKFLYKYEVTNLYSNLTFLNNDVNELFLGTIDVLAKGKGGWYLVILKASKTNYLKKYMAELYLQKVLFETNTGFKVKGMFILNPRSERYIFDYEDLSQKEKRNLLSSISTY